MQCANRISFALRRAIRQDEFRVVAGPLQVRYGCGRLPFHCLLLMLFQCRNGNLRLAGVSLMDLRRGRHDGKSASGLLPLSYLECFNSYRHPSTSRERAVGEFQRSIVKYGGGVIPHLDLLTLSLTENRPICVTLYI